MHNSGWPRASHVPIPFPPPPIPPMIPPPAGSAQQCLPPRFGFWPPSIPPHVPWTVAEQPPLQSWAMPPDFQVGNIRANLTPKPTAPVTVKKTPTQEERDQIFLKNFMQNSNCVKQQSQLDHSQNEVQVMKISEAKKMDERAHTLMKTLEEILKSDTKDENRIAEVKGELNGILSILNDDKVISSLANQVKQRMKKRRRLKTRRYEMYLLKKKQEEQLREKHKKSDEWLMKKQETEDNLKREKQVQKDLDNYLQEINQKQGSLKKSLELLVSLGKLRKARKESALRKGQLPSESHDEVFSSAFKSARVRLQASISSCDEEEKKLRMFLVEEQKLEEERIRKKKLEEERGKREEWDERRWEALFGPKEKLDVSDPMWPVEQLHKQASSSLLSFAHTRLQWDNFVCESGSRIPTYWVEPTEPSSDAWEQYCDSEHKIES